MVDKANKWNGHNVLSTLLSLVIVMVLLRLGAWLVGWTWYELAIGYWLFWKLLNLKGEWYEVPGASINANPQGEQNSTGACKHPEGSHRRSQGDATRIPDEERTDKR